MRFSVAVLAVLASTASALNIFPRQDLPACVAECSIKADLDGCQVTDNNCLCHSEKFVASTTLCIGQTCQGDDLQTAISAAQQLCAAVGVTLTATPSGFPTTTASGASGNANAPSSTGTASTGTASTGAASTGTASTGAASTSATSTTTSGNSDNAAVMNGVNPLAALAVLGVVLAL